MMLTSIIIIIIIMMMITNFVTQELPSRRRRRSDELRQLPLCPPLTHDHHSNYAIILSNLLLYSTPLTIIPDCYFRVSFSPVFLF